MTDDLTWSSIPDHYPDDRQRVYARVKDGLPKKVTFYARPATFSQTRSVACSAKSV